jgi:hypothetical protein
MSARRLSNLQAEALIRLRGHGPRAAYPELNLATLYSLEYREMVVGVGHHGKLFDPKSGIIWHITDAGREALSK